MGYPDWQTTGTLAELIADALQSAGIPLLANPIQLYNTGPATITGTPGIMGAYVQPVHQTQANWESATTQWEQNTGVTVSARKIYFSNGSTPTSVTESVQQCIDQGLQAWLCYTPVNVNPGSITEANNTIASINAFITAGLPAADIVVVFWQELFQGKVAAADCIAGYQYYVPKIRAGCPGVQIGWDTAGQGMPGGVGAFDPGPAYYDLVGTDVYGNEWVSNQGSAFAKTLAVAQAGNKPMCVPEFGTSVGGAVTNANMILFLQWMTNQALTILQNGGKLGAWMWWQDNANAGGPNIINSPGDFRVPYLQALAAAVTTPAGGSGGITIPAGGTVTLNPLTPSPGGGWADAVGLSYDIALQLIAGAGETNPFVTAQLFFYDDDTATARAVDRVYWHLPLGVSTSQGTRIYGNGPQSGRYMSISIHNGGAQTAIVAAQVNSTSRTRDVHDWNWSVADSNAVPTYTLASGAGYSANLGAEQGINVNSGQTKAFLLSLGAGRIWAYASSSGGSMDVQLLPQPSSSFTTEPIWEGTISATSPLAQIVQFPRAPVVIQFTNNGGSAATVGFQFIKDR